MCKRKKKHSIAVESGAIAAFSWLVLNHITQILFERSAALRGLRRERPSLLGFTPDIGGPAFSGQTGATLHTWRKSREGWAAVQTRGKPHKLFTPGTKTKPSEEAELGSGFTPSPAACASGHTGPFALGAQDASSTRQKGCHR